MDFNTDFQSDKDAPKLIITNSTLDNNPGEHQIVTLTNNHVLGLPLLYRDPIIQTPDKLVSIYSELPNVTPTNNYTFIEHSSNINRFLVCLHEAYATHSSISIRADDIWLLIMSGIIINQQTSAEINRVKLVPHQGVETISTKGSKDLPLSNNWKKIIASIESQIAVKLDPNVYNCIVCNYMKSANCTCFASRVSLMSMLDSYYDYKLIANCGIKSIILEGQVEDWRRVLYRAKNLANFNMDWWSKHIVNIVEKIVATFEGERDSLFWQSMYKFDLTTQKTFGWFNVFFPFKIDDANNYVKNDIMWSWKASQLQKKGLSLTEYPLCIYNVNIDDLKISGGFINSAVTVDSPKIYRVSTGFIVTKP